MLNLIIVVMSIALTASLIAVSVSYTPTWVVDYQRNLPIVTKGFCKLEGSVLDYLEYAGETTAPAPLADADGGLNALFGAHYKFLPQVVDQGQWAYGEGTVNSQTYGYICLAGASISEGTYVALKRLQGTLPQGQFVLGNACGATTDVAEPTTFPATIRPTLYITPGFKATTC